MKPVHISRLSRRDFLRLALLGSIGAGAIYIERSTSGMGFGNFLRWSLRGQLQRLRPAAIVGLAECRSYNEDLVSILTGLWNISDMPDLHGKNILVKPNMLDLVRDNLATTNPKIVGAVLDILANLGVGNVIVAEGSGFTRDSYSVVKTTGLSQELDARGIQFIDLNYDELVPVKPRDGWIRKSDKLWLPRHVYEADTIISIPKLKTHHWAGVTLSLKNLFGTIPSCRYGWPKNFIHFDGINATILGIYKTIPPVLSIVDGIIGMEGNGPLYGKAVLHGLLAMGSDPLAVDITCAQLMGFSVGGIPHLNGAAWAGVGQAKRIVTRGVPPEQLQRNYAPPPTF